MEAEILFSNLINWLFFNRTFSHLFPTVFNRLDWIPDLYKLYHELIKGRRRKKLYKHGMPPEGFSQKMMLNKWFAECAFFPPIPRQNPFKREIVARHRSASKLNHFEIRKNNSDLLCNRQNLAVSDTGRTVSEQITVVHKTTGVGWGCRLSRQSGRSGWLRVGTGPYRGLGQTELPFH